MRNLTLTAFLAVLAIPLVSCSPAPDVTTKATKPNSQGMCYGPNGSYPAIVYYDETMSC